MIADFHNDYFMSDKRLEILRDYDSGDNKIVGAIFRHGKDYVYAKSILNAFLKAEHKNLFFAFEDFSYDEDLNNLVHGLLDYRPVYVGLTWNGENNLAYGAWTNGGKIKPRGKAVIKELNKRKIYLDVAHLSEASFYDALNFTDNILCSHTCFYDVQPHARNLKKEQIKEIISLNGLVGLTFCRSFITDKKPADVQDVFKHIDYFASNFGVNNLALGTDFYGCEDFPVGFFDYSFESLLTDCLLTNGYRQTDVDKILFTNLSNFLDKTRENS